MTRDVSLAAWQVRYEVRSFFRNRRAAFFSLFLPIALLLLFGSLQSGQEIASRGDIPLVTYYEPGMIAYGLVLTAFTGLLIGTAQLRDSGVLKRIQGTPLPWWAYLAGRVGATVVALLAMTAAMVVIGYLAFGVHLRAAPLPGLVLALLMGTACFATLALGLSRFVPNAELARPLAIGVILPLSVISGQFFPLDNAPAWLNDVANALPVKAMTDAIQVAFDPRTAGPGIKWGDLLTLGLWTIVGMRLTTGLFRSLSARA